MVKLSWTAVDTATGYRVEQCASPCTGNWAVIATVTQASYADESAEAAPVPAAPQLTLSAETPNDVKLSWPEPSVSPGRAYTYRVAAQLDDGFAGPSEEVIGVRSAWPIAAYAWSYDGLAWQTIAGTSRELIDTTGPAPTLMPGTAKASQGEYAGWVQLTVTGISATPGAARSYRVRAETNGGNSDPSNVVLAQRGAPTIWMVLWERSVDATTDSFEMIAGAAGPTWNDTEAPDNGATRYYRASIASDGLVPVKTTAVVGYRKPPPGTLANLRASTDLEDGIEITWDPVSNATGYRIYRAGLAIQEVGASETSWTDRDASFAVGATWSAPKDVVATTDAPSHVAISWTAPVRPVGPTAEYSVAPINPAGEGERVGPVSGRRALSELVSFEIEISDESRNASEDTHETATAWQDTAALAPTIAAGTIAASQGDRQAHIALTSNNALVVRHNVDYRVRGVLNGNAYTPWSQKVTGARGAGSLQWTWQWASTNTSGTLWSPITGAQQSVTGDANAPVDGTLRYYRLLLSADGATTVTTSTVSGYRLALTDISAGRDHVCALATDKTIWCWGANEAGQLGRGNASTQEATPARVQGITNATQVSAGGAHTCARLSTNGVVKCWGSNSYGQLGDNSQTARLQPVSVSGLNGVAEIGAGEDFTCARLLVGGVRCWGRNNVGQLGDDSQITRLTPVVTSQWNFDYAAQTSSVSPLIDAVALAVTKDNACVVRSGANNSVWCWSGSPIGGTENTGVYRNLASGALGSNILSLAKGSSAHHICAMSSNKVWCWGSDAVEEISSFITPVPTWARYNTYQSGPVAINRYTGITKVAVGFGTTCIYTNTNHLICGGSGGHGGYFEIDQLLPNVIAIAIDGSPATPFALINHGVVSISETSTTPVPFP